MDKEHVRKRLKWFLKEGLKQRNLRVEDVASRLEYSYHTITSWRQGKRLPKPAVLKALEQEFKTKLLS